MPTIQPNVAHPLNRGRVAWWMPTPGRLGGSALWDLMGRYPAQAPSPKPVAVAGWPYASIQLDGTPGVYYQAACPRPTLTNVTVGVRFTPLAGFFAADRGLIGRQTAAGFWNGGADVLGYRISDGRLRSYGGPGKFEAHTLWTPVVGQSAFVALSANMATGTAATIYADGQPLPTTIWSATPGPTMDGVPYTIASSGVDTNRAPILLHEAFVYDRTLSADEVAALYRQMRRGYPDLLVRDRTPLAILSTGSAPAFRPWFVPRSPVLGSGVY